MHLGVRYYVFFVIDIATRRVHIAKITDQPGEAWMKQLARILSDCVDGFLKRTRYLILDRDPHSSKWVVCTGLSAQYPRVMPPLRIWVWVATSGALVLAVCSFWLGPVRLPLAGSAMLAYRSLVALTFDDGPDESSTPFVLETIARYDAKATFFVIEEKAEAHPQLMAAIVEAGHEVGCQRIRP